MPRYACLTATCLVLALHTLAGASHFVVNTSGPHDSVGPWFTSGNEVLFPSYTGTTYLADKITVSGTLTQVHPESYASDSSWWLRASTGTGTAFSIIPQMTFTSNYTSLNLSKDTHGGYWIKNYPQYRFEAVEMGIGNGDQPGVDAQWTNMTFEFHPQVPTISIGWNTSGTAVFDTGGSSFSTQLGIYSWDGILLDHVAGGSGSIPTLDAGNLTPGDYYLIVAASDGTFQDFAAMPGSESGDLTVSFNGESLFDGTLAAERVKIINLRVVPEPSTWALATIALLASIALHGKRKHGDCRV